MKRLRGRIGNPGTYDMQADTGRNQDDPALDGQQNPAKWRTQTAGRRIQSDRRGFQELRPGRRLDIGEQIIVRGKAIEQLCVNLCLDFRETAPAPVIDKRSNQPDQQAHGHAYSDKSSDTAQDIPPQIDGLSRWVHWDTWPRTFTKIEGRVADHLGMSAEEAREPGIRR